MFIPSHSTWILTYLIPIKSSGQAYMVSVFPVYLLAPWHISSISASWKSETEKNLQNCTLTMVG